MHYRTADEDRILPLDELIQMHVCWALATFKGDKLHAAKALGISRSTIYRILSNVPPRATTPPVAPDGGAK